MMLLGVFSPRTCDYIQRCMAHDDFTDVVLLGVGNSDGGVFGGRENVVNDRQFVLCHGVTVGGYVKNPDAYFGGRYLTCLLCQW